jgi:hypothetical protein
VWRILTRPHRGGRHIRRGHSTDRPVAAFGAPGGPGPSLAFDARSRSCLRGVPSAGEQRPAPQGRSLPVSLSVASGDASVAALTADHGGQLPSVEASGAGPVARSRKSPYAWAGRRGARYNHLCSSVKTMMSLPPEGGSSMASDGEGSVISPTSSVWPAIGYPEAARQIWGRYFPPSSGWPAPADATTRAALLARRNEEDAALNSFDQPESTASGGEINKWKSAFPGPVGLPFNSGCGRRNLASTRRRRFDPGLSTR